MIVHFFLSFFFSFEFLVLEEDDDIFSTLSTPFERPLRESSFNNSSNASLIFVLVFDEVLQLEIY